jgi:hypothetical protein
VSFNTPNWQPVPARPEIENHVPPCGQCGHHAGEHHNPTSCSVRGRWLRRCRCPGYTKPDPEPPDQTRNRGGGEF